MHPKNIYNQLLTVIGRQAGLIEKSIDTTLLHYRKHELLRIRIHTLIDKLEQKKERTQGEESFLMDMYYLLAEKEKTEKGD